MLSYPQNLAAVSSWFVVNYRNLEKLTTSMKRLGGNGMAWWLNGMWTATKEQRYL